LTTSLLFAVCSLEALSIGKLVKRARWIGDSTYGIYLWHLPIQIITLIYFSQHEEARAAIHQPWFLVAFLAVVISIARISYLTIEEPSRKWLRQFAEAKKSSAVSAEPSSPLPHPEPHTG